MLLTRLVSEDLRNRSVGSALQESLFKKDQVHGFLGHPNELRLYFDQSPSLTRKEIREKVIAFLNKHLKPIYQACSHHTGITRQQLRITLTPLESSAQPWESPHGKLTRVKDIPLPEDTPPNNYPPYSQPQRPQIFISHSSKDKSLATKLSTYLRVLNYNCFVAHDDIHGGAVWSEEIKENLENMRVFIACITNNFDHSTYCHQESGYAMARQQQDSAIEIVPVKFEELNPSAMLAGIQAVTVGSQKIGGQHLAKIIGVINRATGHGY